ncbi:MAG: CPBP family intramembrane metalloprotease [Clostridiales bacterium]|nr:CPBP family intramembrane metalloprotease [Clostridiales bacterium]
MTNDKKFAANVTVFFVFLTLISVSLLLNAGIKLTDNQAEIFYTLVSQIVCMGIIPFALFNLLYKRKKESGVKGEAFTTGNVSADAGFSAHISLAPPQKKILPKVLGITLLMLIVNTAAAGIGYVFIQLLGYKPTDSAGSLYPNVFSLIIALFMTAALPAIFEEFTFRGILLGAYKDAPAFGVVISSFLFALMHMNVLQFPYTFIGGVVLALLTLKTRSILSASILHFGINAFSVIRSYGYQHTDSLANIINDAFNLLNSPLVLLIVAGLAAYGIARLFKTIDKDKPFDMTRRAGDSLKSYAFMAGSVVFGGLMTVFSFVWGILR